MIVVGIDPGISGAVVRLDGDDKTLQVWRDFKEPRDIATAVQFATKGPIDKVVIEAVHAMPGEGVCSVFSFGRSTGIALGATFTTHDPAPVQVSPQKWQNYFRKKYGLPKGVKFKELTRQLATTLFPAHADLFKRKKDHGTSDAALIALWAKENL